MKSRRPSPNLDRRDFLNGVALTGMAAWSLTGMPRIGMASTARSTAGTRWGGNAPDVIDAAHAVRDGRYARLPATRVSRSETYDLVVVGTGLSGLAAAYSALTRAHRPLSVLLLDNQREPGGAARADVFRLRGEVLMAAQGSIVSQRPPPALATYAESELLLRELLPNVDDYVVPHMDRGFGVVRREGGGTRLYRSLFDAPIPEAVKPGYFGLLGEAAALYSSPDWRGVLAAADAYTLPQYIERRGWPGEVFQWMVPEIETFFGIADEVSAGAVLRQYGGGVPTIRAFPGGNSAVVAELLAALGLRGRRDVPPGGGRVGEVPRRPTLRQGATVVTVDGGVSGADSPVRVHYLRNGRLNTAGARAVVMAGGAFMARHLIPDLSPGKHDALRRLVHVPIVWINVLLANARAYDRADPPFLTITAGTRATMMMAFEKRSESGWTGERSSERPVLLGLSLPFNVPGRPVREQASSGRAALLDTPFAAFEEWVRSDLDAVLGPYGFDAGRDIAAVSVCRWGHGYSFPDPGLLSGDVLQRAAQPEGRIVFANTDLDGFSHISGALGHGCRAATEALAVLAS